MDSTGHRHRPRGGSWGDGSDAEGSGVRSPMIGHSDEIWSGTPRRQGRPPELVSRSGRTPRSMTTAYQRRRSARPGEHRVSDHRQSAPGSSGARRTRRCEVRGVRPKRRAVPAMPTALTRHRMKAWFSAGYPSRRQCGERRVRRLNRITHDSTVARPYRKLVKRATERRCGTWLSVTVTFRPWRAGARGDKTRAVQSAKTRPARPIRWPGSVGIPGVVGRARRDAERVFTAWLRCTGGCCRSRRSAARGHRSRSSQTGLACRGARRRTVSRY